MSEHCAPKGHRVGYHIETPREGGPTIQHDLMACVHCGYVWEPKPGSGKKRGFCYRCNGFVCGHAECLKKGCVPQERWLEAMERGIDPSQMPVIVSVPGSILFGGR
jgi:hypothetical protein